LKCNDDNWGSDGGHCWGEVTNGGSDVGAMNDDVEADDEATSVRSQWKRIYSSQ
jgi:hypothetical protein